MFKVRLAGGHLYGKQLFTWLSLVVSLMASFVLSFFPLDVLDEIWDLIESVSEGFLTYSSLLQGTHDLYFELIKVLGISLSYLLYDGFHSCLFLYSCMLRGSAGRVSCLNTNRNSHSYRGN